ncbi:type II toxin-antitoxin system PemK/MazF family toxin [bacterium]|nr:type II toxin-antitoxin system PemK/MazF family toxin [bacterium]
MVMRVRRFEVYLVNLEPTRGREIEKTRPCLVISCAGDCRQPP